MNDNAEFDKLCKMMEEFANAPREEMGKRQPGELCSYEKPYPPFSTECLSEPK